MDWNARLERFLLTIFKVSGFDLVASRTIDRVHILQLRPGLSDSGPLQAAMLEIVPAGAGITHPPI